MSREVIWSCKIGVRTDAGLPSGADFPMRKAVEHAFLEVVGKPDEFNFSGWGATLTANEREVIEAQRNEVENALRRLWDIAPTDEVHNLLATIRRGLADSKEGAQS